MLLTSQALVDVRRWHAWDRGMDTLPAFDLVAERLARCMSDLADLMHEIEFDGGPT